jgi:hypothetical protein
MDKQEFIPCEVCGAEATRFFDEPTEMAFCEYHASQVEARADNENERQQEAELDNE